MLCESVNVGVEAIDQQNDKESEREKRGKGKRTMTRRSRYNRKKNKNKILLKYQTHTNKESGTTIKLEHLRLLTSLF